MDASFIVTLPSYLISSTSIFLHRQHFKTDNKDWRGQAVQKLNLQGLRYLGTELSSYLAETCLAAWLDLDFSIFQVDSVAWTLGQSNLLGQPFDHCPATDRYHDDV